MSKTNKNGSFWRRLISNQMFIPLLALLLLAVMITQLDFKQVWEGLQHAGYWFVAVLVLWFFLYSDEDFT